MLELLDFIFELCFFINEVDIGFVIKFFLFVFIGEFLLSFIGDWSDFVLLFVGDLLLIGDNLLIFDADDILYLVIFLLLEFLVEEVILVLLFFVVCLAFVEVLVRVEEFLELLGLEVFLVFL